MKVRYALLTGLLLAGCAGSDPTGRSATVPASVPHRMTDAELDRVHGSASRWLTEDEVRWVQTQSRWHREQTNPNRRIELWGIPGFRR